MPEAVPRITNLRQIGDLSPEAARGFLAQCRWRETEGAPVCPECGRTGHYFLATRGVYKCKRCSVQYTVTSKTLFHSRKADHKSIIYLAFLFASAAKGVSSGQMGRTLGLDQKTAFYLCHKLRHAILCEVSRQKLEGEIEVDGAVFGGHFRHANVVSDGRTKRYKKKHFDNKRVIIVARQRGGRTVPFVGYRESDALRDVARVVKEGATLYADEARAWDRLSRIFSILRVKHKSAFSFAGACTNNAEGYFAQMRKLHNGTHHKISGEMMRAYACEMAWRMDHAKMSQAERTEQLLHIALQPTDQRVLWRDPMTEPKRPSAEIIQLHPDRPPPQLCKLSAGDETRLPAVLDLVAANEG